MEVHSTESRAVHLCCSGAPSIRGGFGGGGRGFAGRTGFDYYIGSANSAEQSGTFKHDPGSQVTEFLHGALQGHPAEAAALAGAAAGSHGALAVTTAMALQICRLFATVALVSMTQESMVPESLRGCCTGAPGRGGSFGGGGRGFAGRTGYDYGNGGGRGGGRGSGGGFGAGYQPTGNYQGGGQG